MQCAAIFNVTTPENLSDVLEFYKGFAALWGLPVLFGFGLVFMFWSFLTTYNITNTDGVLWK